jgi:hypothetical protein
VTISGWTLIRPRYESDHGSGEFTMLRKAVLSGLTVLVFWLPSSIHPQANMLPSSCPITFVKVSRPDYANRWNISTRVRNASGKKIVGMIFNSAVADAAEQWAWIPEGNRIAELDWNRELNPGQSKTLSWYLMSNLNETLYFNQPYYHQHGSGGTIVLTRVLYGDGSSWENSPDLRSCMGLWYSPHKKSFVKPIQLPNRD